MSSIRSFLSLQLLRINGLPKSPGRHAVSFTQFRAQASPAHEMRFRVTPKFSSNVCAQEALCLWQSGLAFQLQNRSVTCGVSQMLPLSAVQSFAKSKVCPAKQIWLAA